MPWSSWSQKYFSLNFFSITKRDTEGKQVVANQGFKYYIGIQVNTYFLSVKQKAW